ncbi:MAG: HNH endonuclease, partial [Alphaproteobacteria bacterium]|nr:HNH endonuclease [Alphaproteobacteria bacterium]
NARGNQGGILIPKEFAEFFPPLNGNVSPTSPTLDENLTAELFVEDTQVATVETRYQLQTRGGTRTPERRITANLGPIYNIANGGDMVIFQRSLEDERRIRITLLPKNSASFSEMLRKVGKKRWGTVDVPPVTNTSLAKSQIEIDQISEGPFKLFVNEKSVVVSRVTRIARELAFRKRVLGNFDFRCSITGRSMFDVSGASGIDAAHIVPLARNGTNDVRNGLALSKDLHWAFDHGMIAVESGIVVVSKKLPTGKNNDYVLSMAGTKLQRAEIPALEPAKEALDWHLANIFVQ